MLKFVRTRAQLIDCLARSGGDVAEASREVERVMTQQLNVITALGPEAAIELIEMIEASSVLPEHRGTIVKHVQSKVRFAFAVEPAVGDEHLKQSDFYDP